MSADLSANRLKQLGHSLREGRLQSGTDQWIDYVDYLSACDLLRAAAERRVRARVGDGITVTGRTKSTDTLREKLIRTPTMQLPSIDDVIGIRVVGEITLSQQNTLAEALSEEFDGVIRTRDRRIEPSAGYRALHVIVRSGGARVEIQIRTRLQAEWADLFERLADRWGRQIRYGLAPDPDGDGSAVPRSELIGQLQTLSTSYIAEYERALENLAADDVPATRVRMRRGPQVSRKELALAMRLRESDKAVATATKELADALSTWRQELLAAFDELAKQAASIP